MLITLEVDVNLHFDEKDKLSLTVHGEERAQQRGFKKSHIKLITENGSEFGQGAFLLRNQDYLEVVSQIKFDIQELTKKLSSFKNKDNKTTDCSKFKEKIKQNKAQVLSKIRKLKTSLGQLSKSKNKKVVIREKRLVTCYFTCKSHRQKLRRRFSQHWI